MDVPVVIPLLLLLFCGLSTQLPQNAITTPGVNAQNTTTCVTAKGVTGSCVDRTNCDFSTSAIDLSLYAPKGYKKTCNESAVCCPFNFQTPEEPKKKLDNDDFMFYANDN